MEEKKERQYTMKEVAETTGLSNDLIRLYEKEFAITVHRTGGGHRRYSEENITLLKSIRDKIQTDGWSYEDVREWLSGALTPKVIAEPETRKNLESRLEALEELAKSQNETLNMQNKILQVVVQKLDAFPEELRKEIRKEIHAAVQQPTLMLGQLLAAEEKNNTMFAEMKENIRKATDESPKEVEPKKKKWFQRFLK